MREEKSSCHFVIQRMANTTLALNSHIVITKIIDLGKFFVFSVSLFASFTLLRGWRYAECVNSCDLIIDSIILKGNQNTMGLFIESTCAGRELKTCLEWEHSSVYKFGRMKRS